MQRVRSRHDQGVKLPACRVPILCRINILQQSEFLHSLVRNIQERPGNTLRVVVNAIDLEVVIARPLTADRRSRAGANSAGACYTRRLQRKVNYPKTYCCSRQVLHFLQREGRCNLSRSCIDRNIRYALHFDGGRLTGDHRKVVRLNVVRGDVDTLDRGGRKTLSYYCDVVVTIRKV